MTFLSRIRDQVLGQNEDVTHHSVLSEVTLCNHVLIEGAANTGLAGLVEDALIEQTANERGWIFIDTTPDEDLRDRLALAAEKAGRADEFYVLDLQNPEESAELDVFRGSHPFDSADRVLTVLPTAHSDFYGPLLHLLARLFELADSNERTLGARHLSSLLTHLNEPETRERLLGLLPTKDTHFREHVLLPFESPEGEATQAAMALGAQLAALANAGWDQVINSEHPDLDFGNVLAFNKMCLIRVPLHHDIQAQVGLKIIWKQICSSLNARRHTPAREKHDFLLAIEGIPSRRADFPTLACNEPCDGPGQRGRPVCGVSRTLPDKPGLLR
nr:hypothetical protein [Silvimonas iriomotensis]